MGASWTTLSGPRLACRALSPQTDYGLLSGELQLSPASSEGDRFSVDIAYNSIDDEFLVVWHNVWGGGFRDIYARRVTSRWPARSPGSASPRAQTAGTG